MDRVFVVTVGTSLLGSEGRATRDGHEEAAVDAGAFGARRGRFERNRALPDDLEAAARSFVDKYPGLLSVLPAEFGTMRLDTTQPAEFPDTRAPVRRGDHVFLLSSDTPEGEFCAKAVGVMIETEPGVKAEVQVLKGVDVGLDDDFERASAKPLAALLARAWTLARDNDAILSFHLSGGYKVTIPMLIYLASHLPSRSGSQKLKAEAFLKHEKSHLPIRLPILLGGIAPGLAADIESIQRNQTIVQGSWEGYAYRHDEGMWKITYLGEVIRDLLNQIR